MSAQNFTSSITANISPLEATKRVCRVPDWWTAKTSGPSSKVGDAFNINWGETWLDISVAELEPEAFQSWLSDPAATPHGGESVEELIARIKTWLNGALLRQEHIIAITHPAVMRAAVLAAINAGFDLGADVIALQASPMGLPVYQKLGFRTITGNHQRLLVVGNGPQSTA